MYPGFWDEYEERNSDPPVRRRDKPPLVKPYESETDKLRRLQDEAARQACIEMQRKGYRG